MREATSRILDSLPQIGGQLTALYPEKWIFDTNTGVRGGTEGQP